MGTSGSKTSPPPPSPPQSPPPPPENEERGFGVQVYIREKGDKERGDEKEEGKERKRKLLILF